MEELDDRLSSARCQGPGTYIWCRVSNTGGCPVSPLFWPGGRLFAQKTKCGERLWNKPKPNRRHLAIQGLFHTTCGSGGGRRHEIVNRVNKLNLACVPRAICAESMSIRISSPDGVDRNAGSRPAGHRVNGSGTNRCFHEIPDLFLQDVVVCRLMPSIGKMLRPLTTSPALNPALNPAPSPNPSASDTGRK